MTITVNEVAVDNQMRRTEKQNQSPLNRLLEGAASTAEAISVATGSVAIGGVAKALGIARKFTSGLGVATLDENLDHLGDATEAALSRVERNLDAQGVRIDEIERRLNSKEFLEGIKAATLQAQRTKDKKRLERMALILANDVAENDLEAESLDDMMRAAAELRDYDVQVLGSIYKMQISLFTPTALQAPYVNRLSNLHDMWKNWWKGDGACYLRDEGMAYRSSCVRLQTVGFVASIGSSSILDGPNKINYELLLEGKKFYERIQVIGATS